MASVRFDKFKIKIAGYVGGLLLSRRASALLFLGAIIVGWLAYVFSVEATFLGTKDPVIVDDGPKQDIWFTPKGQLSTVACSGEILLAKLYDANKGRLIYAREINLQKALAASGYNTSKSSCAVDDFPYAISDDATTISWIQKNSIRNCPILGLKKCIPIEIHLDVNATDLALTRGTSIVSALGPDGVVINYENFKKTAWSAGAVSEGGWRLSQRGPQIAASNVATGATGVVNLDLDAIDNAGENPIRWLENKFRSSLDAAIGADDSVLAVGNGNGLVTITSLKEGEEHGRSVFLPSGGRIRSIASVGRGDLIVGGDFPGIFLIAGGRLIQEVAVSPPHVRLIAASSEHIAYATDREVVLMCRVPSLRLSESGKYRVGVGFGLLGLLGFLQACLADKKRPEDIVTPPRS